METPLSESETTSVSNWKVIRKARRALRKGHFHFGLKKGSSKRPYCPKNENLNKRPK